MADDISHIKAPQVQEGWTQVKSKTRCGRKSKHVHTGGQTLLPLIRTDNLRSCSDILKEYHKVRTQVGTEMAGLEICRLVKNHSPIPINRAVCLGIGTFDPPEGGWETKRRTFAQLIVFLIMVEELEKISRRKIKCFFQEPLFTSSDKAFLTSLGHQCVDSPEGFEVITPDTLLFGVHLYRPIYSKALERSLPAIFVGTDLEVWDLVSIGDSGDMDKAKIMEDTYTKIPCPQDSSSTAFSGTCIYWRPSKVDSSQVEDDEKEGGNLPAQVVPAEAASTSNQSEAGDDIDIANKLQSISLS